MLTAEALPVTNTTAQVQAPGAHAQATALLARQSAATAPGTAASPPSGGLESCFYFPEEPGPYILTRKTAADK